MITTDRKVLSHDFFISHHIKKKTNRFAGKTLLSSIKKEKVYNIVLCTLHVSVAHNSILYTLLYMICLSFFIGKKNEK